MHAKDVFALSSFAYLAYFVVKIPPLFLHGKFRANSRRAATRRSDFLPFSPAHFPTFSRALLSREYRASRPVQLAMPLSRLRSHLLWLVLVTFHFHAMAGHFEVLGSPVKTVSIMGTAIGVNGKGKEAIYFNCGQPGSRSLAASPLPIRGFISGAR